MKSLLLAVAASAGLNLLTPAHEVEKIFRPALTAYLKAMEAGPSSLAKWTPEQIARGREWVRAWERAGQMLEQLRRAELHRLDAQRAIALLCGPADYRVPPRAPKPTSGLVEQQYRFTKARQRD